MVTATETATLMTVVAVVAMAAAVERVVTAAEKTTSTKKGDRDGNGVGEGGVDDDG